MSWNYRIVNTKIIIPLLSLLVLLLYTIGCSSNNYTVANENKVFLPVESKTQKRLLENEDQLIVKAIYMEELGAYKESSQLYAHLYEKTRQDEYLIREANTAHHAGMIPLHLTQLEEYVQCNPKHFQLQRLLLSFYLKQKNLNKAKKMGTELTTNSNQAVDFELAANPYIFSGDYEESINYLREAYKKTLNEDILLKIITIEINYLNDIASAIKDLEAHKKSQGCSEKICLQLISIYAQQGENKLVVSLYKELYQKTKRTIYSEKIIESYLLNQEIHNAIAYLEKERNNNPLLYALYMEKKEYKKANLLTHYLFNETQDPKWYAESAISRFESLKDKNDKVELQKVIEDFEKYLAVGEQNPIYLNYYGYTLIDKELDISKGLQAIEKALALEPENTYFLDSLAWGHYKLDNCAIAYPTMKKVVEVEGLNEEEIILHWRAIENKCSK